jgi:tellurite methyltransferase
VAAVDLAAREPVDRLTAVDDARATWNRRHREREAPAERQPPAEWLSDNHDALASRVGGRALDLACGTGRNALYLARLGFTVDAVDVSDVAVQQLTATAGRAGAAVHARVADLEQEGKSLPPAAYELVVLINYLQRDLFAVIPETLAPGGIVIAETVTRAHIEQLQRPFDPRFVLEPGELATAFAGLHVLRYREAVVQRGGRPRAVASVLAELSV